MKSGAFQELPDFLLPCGGLAWRRDPPRAAARHGGWVHCLSIVSLNSMLSLCCCRRKNGGARVIDPGAAVVCFALLKHRNWSSHIITPCCFLFYEIVLMTFAGTPPTTVFAGTSLCTTAPAATTAPSPIVTPCRIVAFAPIHTFFPMRIGAG